MLGLDAKVQMTASCRLIYHPGRGCSLPLHPPHHPEQPPPTNTPPNTHTPLSLCLHGNQRCVHPPLAEGSRLQTFLLTIRPHFHRWNSEKTQFSGGARRTRRARGPHRLQQHTRTQTHNKPSAFWFAWATERRPADCINLITSSRHTAAATFIMLPCKLFSHAANQH